jgi:hypothetical protein
MLWSAKELSGTTHQVLLIHQSNRKFKIDTCIQLVYNARPCSGRLQQQSRWSRTNCSKRQHRQTNYMGNKLHRSEHLWTAQAVDFGLINRFVLLLSEVKLQDRCWQSGSTEDVLYLDNVKTMCFALLALSDSSRWLCWWSDDPTAVYHSFLHPRGCDDANCNATRG